MSKPIHKVGDTVKHKLTGERMIVIEVKEPYDTYYKCRAGDYTVVNCEGCEIDKEPKQKEKR